MRRFHWGEHAGVPRRPLSYANIAATLALVFAVGGGSALAASGGTSKHKKPKPHHHCVITSTNQIAPSVLSRLHGANGTNGTNGSTGPSGPTGPTGSTGAAGAAAGYSASHFTAQDFTSATSGSPATILTKSLPAGDFLISGKTGLSASTTTNPTNPSTDVAFVNDTCELSDGSVVDEDQWNSTISEESVLGTFTASGTASMAITVASSTPSTVTLSCWNVASAGAGFATSAAFSTIQAVQVQSLG